MRTKRYILSLLFSACVCAGVYAQTDTIRYVHPNGAFNNNGRSWATATNKLQDAINDLRDYLRANNLSSGSVYVAAGTYVPTESTEALGGSMLNTSFKIYAGIHVYGGFNPDAPESNPGDRIMANGKKVKDNWSDPTGIGTTSGDSISSQWDLRYKTILTGNHSTASVKFTFDSIRGYYNMTFPASSFHVVWFATNGTYEGVQAGTEGHYKPLENPASLNGCVIREGNASSRSTTIRDHTAYGGGVYMVGNSEIKNCIIEYCNATLRGGGIYMDGGGVAEFCLVHTCESGGVGMLEGYGGGVCIDHNGSLGHSHVTSCAARCGGGLMISCITGEYPDVDDVSRYSPYSSASVINNNTAAAEGGGVYLANGGTINHGTVTANNCIGRDVTYYGRRHGRSGGIYIRNCGMIFNSVFWGNRCDANNDIQFATVHQESGADYETFVYHSAFMNHDISDWTGVQKEMVFSLEKDNMPTKGSMGNFCCFFDPTVNPNNWNDTLPGAGVFMNYNTPATIPGPRIWHLTSYSAIDQKGVQVNDAIQDVSPWLRHAHTDYGVVSNPYEPVSTLGGLVRKPDPVTYALVPMQGLEGREDPNTLIPTLFIDPNRKGVYDSNGNFVAQDREGNSWDAPIRDIGEAIKYFRQYLQEGANDTHYYNIPALDPVSGMATGEKVRHDYVQILVKQGTLTTVGPGNYLDRNIRTAAIRLESHMRLYGGYPSSLDGTTTAGRNPRDYKSTITANLTGIGGVKAYENNAAHVIVMANAEHVVVDGFTLSDANTHNVYQSQSAHAGGGILLNNANTAQSKRIHMMNNQVRNCVINNCASPMGAAVYANGEYLNADNEVCYAELWLVNCVIRNNKADYTVVGENIHGNGIISANGRAFIHLEHCDVVNNVGFPLKSDSKHSESDAPITDSHGNIYRGYIRMDNSLLFCNGDRVLEDRSSLGSEGRVTSVNEDGQDYIFGLYNIFDADLYLHSQDPTMPHGFFQNGYTVPTTNNFLPNGVNSLFTMDIAGIPADSTERNNRCIFTRNDASAMTYPTFVNPARNVGNTPSGDRPLYGGIVSYTPTTTNPCVNAARINNYTNSLNNFDRSDVLSRDRGGAPDVGAIENQDLPASGTVIYVTPNGAGKRDGSSWGNAIAGNLVYQIGGSYVVDTEHGDGEGNTVTTRNNLYRGGYAVDYVWHSGTTNYIDKQTITQKRINLTYTDSDHFTTADGGETVLGEKTNEQSVTTSNTLTREKTEFIYGEKSGASRDFYRTNLKDSQVGLVTIDANGFHNTDFNNSVSITNSRAEDFVSGLQFAVEKAAEINKDRNADNRVQVWVGNGIYEDYKGYVMRDKVEVYGGFPAQKYKAPAMSERHALVSSRIPVSSKDIALDAEKEQYETILQISDKKPFDESTWLFDPSVMLYRDKDYTESGDKTITTTTSITIPVYYRRDTIPGGGYTEYHEVPGDNVTADLSSHIVNPGFEQNMGKSNWDATKAKYGWTNVTGFTLAGSTNHCAWIKNNSAIDFYQELNNLEPGLYRISCQAFNKGKAKDNVKLFANGEERVLMNISDADNAVAVNQTTYANWFASGKYADNWVDVYVGESGHLRFGFKGAYSGTDGWTVFDNFKLERLSGGEDITSSTTVEKAAGYVDKTFSKQISAFRKPVLYMPDICMSTWWPGTIDGSDNTSNERRQNVNGKIITPKIGTGYVQYDDVRWDGFTIRNGFIYDYYANRDGGGGVRMFEGVKLAHCVVVDNTVNWSFRTRGGGAYCDGRTSEVISCFFLNNLNSGIRNATPTSSNDKNSNGGGIYLLVGTCYNSLFANNVCWGKDPRGAGIYIEQATFYNNTVAYNTCRMQNKSIMTANGTAVHQYDGDGGAQLKVYNTIMYGNTGKAIGAVKENLLTSFDNCYVQSSTGISSTVQGKMRDCILYNNQNPTAATNPFERGEEAPNENNFRLAHGSLCINKGAIPADYEGVFPDKDVDFANRIQDCQIDIGAYEYNAALGIKPDTTTHPGHAIFYVAYDSPGGDASASSPENAACAQKLQLIIDAAGRYKYALMTQTRYNSVNPTPVAGSPDKSWTVEVRLLGDSLHSTTSSDYAEWYTPTRSSKHGNANYNDNTLDYSFIIPHGVQIKGGYKPGFHHIENGQIVDDRDPLTYRTVLSGKITSNTGAAGQCFHVVSFTNNLFDEYEQVMDAGGQLAMLTDEKDRAVVDGLFIEDGYANSPNEEDKIGAGAVVTEYAHIRNCVVQNNEAVANGGGLYLKPYALVSGTIVKKNSAEIGGGIYIEAPAMVNSDSLAHVYASTVCENLAQSSAGGIWFENTYARVSSTVVWHNSANDNANVSGNFSRSSENTDYPFNFCAIESRRLEGQGNIELSPSVSEGVRWDNSDPFHAILYYPIEMSSTLSRAGMTYKEWINVSNRFKTLDSIDIAGVSRMKWTSDGQGTPRGFAWGNDTLVTKNNDFIEIGARALNKTFQINVDEKYVMRRLFVMHTDFINSEAARALQANTNTDSISLMYKQLGSCFLNPFHRLGDAFDYIIAARKANPAKYRSARFEVFVEQGTYYPYHNAYGEQDQVRNNTFLIPEATSVIGGVNSQMEGHSYGQAGYVDGFNFFSIGDGNDVPIPGTGYSINFALSDSIVLRDDRHRRMQDNNLNSVIEPWELERQTILSGNAVAGEDYTHVYHVITIHADSTKVGPQPYKYKAQNTPEGMAGGGGFFTDRITDPNEYGDECSLSIQARAIELDGLQITGGYANHLDGLDTVNHHYQTKTYFRGGGILVDGNWTESFDDENDTEVPYVTTPANYNIALRIENCFFINNMAANGGAIYTNGSLFIYKSHFTQNYSQGPMTKLDQKFIPWSAGGCIAANAFCGVSNTLFANNEARRGLYPITLSGAENIPDADARQGFGGGICAARTAAMRVLNCHFMKNKGVAYSAIYNFLANNNYSTSDSMQFAFNTIFWGNEVFEVDNLDDIEYKEPPTTAAKNAYLAKYKASRAGVFHYDGDVWDRYEKLFHEYDSLYNYWSALRRPFETPVVDKLRELRQVGDSMEGLYFCSYRKTYGPSGMRPNKEGYLMTADEFERYTDTRQFGLPLKINSKTNDWTENFDTLFTYLHGNNNVLINRVNSTPDGPNFKQPSYVAGIDGYMQNADWLCARMNITTDQGWGHLKQRVEQHISYYITKYTGSMQFATQQEALDYAIAHKPDTVAEVTVQDVYPIKGLPSATFNGVEQPEHQPMYNYFATRYGQFRTQDNQPSPLGEQHYMTFTRNSNEGKTGGIMHRISKNPRPQTEDVYIDLGIYEYQYVQLDIDGQEIDTMWVSTKAKSSNVNEQNGLSWETPTTDLQWAIDMLMSSHNNHDKYICLIGDTAQHFSPNNVFDNRRTFIISTSSMVPLMPDSTLADQDYYVKSLNFLGGYSYDVKERDPMANPTVIEMPNIGNTNQLNQLFIIEDMTRKLVQVNWQGEYITRDTIAIPITFDGITFINPYSTKDVNSNAEDYGGVTSQKGGAAIYYRWQRQYENIGGMYTPNFNMTLCHDTIHIGDSVVTKPKLTIANCIFMDNGERTSTVGTRSPAVRIDHGGGSTLIVNSLFHSNAGDPIFARRHDMVVGENNLAAVPNDVVIVNSTFALNGGHITLESDNNELHNSLIWLDDLAEDTLTQLEFHNDKWDRAVNKDHVGIAGRVTNNAIWGCFQSGDDTYHNDPLSTDNNDVFEGPYFASPDTGATTAEQRRARSFRLNPSARTINMADTAIYRLRTLFRSPQTDYDLASTTRVHGPGMERGAYECTAALQRVLYVQPNMPAAMAGDGSSWESPLGQGQLQKALDAAAVYTYLNKTMDNETRKAYVFVKGSYDSNDKNDLIAHDGVNMYGSLPSNFSDTVWMNPDSTAYTNGECLRYVNYVRSVATGVASPDATPTRINSLNVSGADYEIGFVMDGFVFNNAGDTLHTSPLVLNNNHTTVRNCLFTDNIVEGAPVADIQRGLLYNSLFYNDSASTIVRVGANGLLLNNTIVAPAGSQPLDITSASADAVQNNIAVAGTATCFAPYMTQNNAYTLPAYLTQRPALGYQLHEHSSQINSGVDDSTLPAVFAPYRADSIIAFWRDRDILGNPRRIGGMVDNGAFETWRVEPNTIVALTSLTNSISLETEIKTSPYPVLRSAFTTHYGGNAYPHRGSVVYLMDSSAMTMGYENQDFRDIYFRPGFMLLKPGASFYGNGNNVQMNYLAAEKRFINQRYSMTAFPYDYYVNNVISTTYNNATDALTQNLSAVPFQTYQYSGAARSAKDYAFQTNESPVWLRVDTARRSATEGYLMDFGAANDTVLRFTAYAPVLGQYAYTEDDEDKTVTLTQYDNRTPGTGSGLNFTRQEDMGWNMKGLPWLVSGYRTDTILEGETYLRQMYIPHVYYQMDQTGNGLSVGDQMQTLRSWDRGSTMSMGNAFFAQTATQKDKEQLIFHLPYFGRNEKVGRPLLLLAPRPAPNHKPAQVTQTLRRGYAPSADMLTVIPDPDADKNIKYSYGRDGIKWFTNDSVAQVYMLDSKRLSRISLLGAAPVETDIPLGVKIPCDYTYTFSLPEKSAFAAFGYVWLIDNRENRTINLLEQDYETEIAAGENNTRFLLRIGGYPLDDEKGKRKYVVFTYQQQLFVRGLVAGDKIDIYTPSGQKVYSTTATAPEWQMPLTYQSGYIVKVNSRAYKVLNM